MTYDNYCGILVKNGGVAMKTERLAKYTLWANRLVMAVVAVLIFCLPNLIRWYGNLLHYAMPEGDLMGIWVS